MVSNLCCCDLNTPSKLPFIFKSRKIIIIILLMEEFFQKNAQRNIFSSQQDKIEILLKKKNEFVEKNKIQMIEDVKKLKFPEYFLKIKRSLKNKSLAEIFDKKAFKVSKSELMYFSKNKIENDFGTIKSNSEKAQNQIENEYCKIDENNLHLKEFAENEKTTNSNVYNTSNIFGEFLSVKNKNDEVLKIKYPIPESFLNVTEIFMPNLIHIDYKGKNIVENQPLNIKTSKKANDIEVEMCLYSTYKEILNEDINNFSKNDASNSNKIAAENKIIHNNLDNSLHHNTNLSGDFEMKNTPSYQNNINSLMNSFSKFGISQNIHSPNKHFITEKQANKINFNLSNISGEECVNSIKNPFPNIFISKMPTSINSVCEEINVKQNSSNIIFETVQNIELSGLNLVNEAINMKNNFLKQSNPNKNPFSEFSLKNLNNLMDNEINVKNKSKNPFLINSMQINKNPFSKTFIKK